MHEKLLKTPMILIVLLAAALMISCSEEQDRSTKHQLPPAGEATTGDATSVTTPDKVKPVQVEERDVRVPILVYDEMDVNIELGWDKVDGPISDYKHATLSLIHI